MERDEIMLLLEKYWKAETTVREEKLIKEYFDKHPGEQSMDSGEWFSAVNQTRRTPIPIALGKSKANRIRKRRFISIAAGILIATGMCLGGISYHNAIETKKRMIILKQAEADLIFISHSLQQGYSDFNDSQETILKIQSSKQQQQ